VNGTPGPALMELGGWQSMTMVDRYSHLDPGFAAQFAENGTSKWQTNGKLANSAVSGKAKKPKGINGVTDGTRTHNNRNHNPGLYL
jgi:hypothetical protein